MDGWMDADGEGGMGRNDGETKGHAMPAWGRVRWGYLVKVVEGCPELLHLLLADTLGISGEDLVFHLVDGAGNGGEQLLPSHTDMLREEEGVTGWMGGCPQQIRSGGRRGSTLHQLTGTRVLCQLWPQLTPPTDEQGKGLGT